MRPFINEQSVAFCSPASGKPRVLHKLRVQLWDILSVAARFYALVLGGTEPAFYR